MNFKRVPLFLPALGLSLLISFLPINHGETLQTNAYAPSTLPTTISLKPCAEEEVRAYYAPLSSLPENRRQGEGLLQELKPLLKKGQKYWSYESGADLWKMYEITDRDWAKSPASAIPGYDASTQEIRGYVYGSSASSPGTDPFVRALYVNRDVDNLSKAWGDHQQTQWGINREHIWPKSQGFESKGKGGARGDPMHLWPGNGRVNGTEHNNNPYGFVDLSLPYQDPVTAKGYENLAGNFAGTSLTLPAGSKVFEPQDSDKGDIARSVFYMAARYQFLDPFDPDGISSDNPNLRLAQEAAIQTSYDSTLERPGTMGVLSDLLAWNRLDPPDDFERQRNDLLHRNFTGNRNPFIDFPSWAEAIWGTAVYEGREMVSYDPNDLFPVDPAKDSLHGFGEGSSGSVILSEEEKEVRVGDRGSFFAVSSSSAPISYVASGARIRLSKSEGASGEVIEFEALEAGIATIEARASISGKESKSRLILRISPAPSPIAEGVVDTLNLLSFPVSGSGYQPLEGVSFPESGTTYSACLAQSKGAMQLNVADASKSRYPGFVMTKAQGEALSVRFHFASNTTPGRKVRLYGKRTPYASLSDLYDASLHGEMLGEAEMGNGVVEIAVPKGYPYLGFASTGGVLYLEKVEIVHASLSSPNAISVQQTRILYPGDHIAMSALSVKDQMGQELFPFDLLFDDGGDAKKKRLGYADVPDREGGYLPCRVVYVLPSGERLETRIELKVQRRSASTPLSTARDLASWIMRGDEGGQCLRKYAPAKEGFSTLSDKEKSLFLESEDPCYAEAKARLIAWASYHGETLARLPSGPAFVRLSSFAKNEGTPFLACVAVILSLGGAFPIAGLVRRKRRQGAGN